MTDRSERDHDDGKVWGHIEGGIFWAIPKYPMLAAGLGPPPFNVTLPSGKVRHVVHEPTATVTAIPPLRGEVVSDP